QGSRRHAPAEIRDLVVIVPSPRGHTEELRDSLASLANQTVTGFEVLVVSPADLSPADFPNSPKFTTMFRQGKLAALLNAGIAAARGRRIAFLPAGDIYFPFHLEVLANRASEAVYSAWSVSFGDGRGAPRLDQAEPEKLSAGDWAPLVCWMHAAPPLFDESLDEFCGWDWVLRLRARPLYVRRVTCEKTARSASAVEAARVIAAHPADGPACEWDRKRFVAAVGSGLWERKLIGAGNLMERRARQMLDNLKLREKQRELADAKERLLNSASTAAAVERPAVLLFSIIRWTDLTQRPHHFARGLAARGIPVFWIDVQLKAPKQLHGGNLSIEIEPNLFYVELPGTEADLYRMEWNPATLDAMTAAFAALGVTEAIQLVNFPKWTPLVLRLRERFGWPIVYDCLDDQQAFGGLYPGNAPELEPQLIRESKVLITSGHTLYTRHQPNHPDAMLIPNAADFDLFAGARPSGRFNHLPHPIIGFFGAFSDWLDLDWIGESARRFPKWSFVYIGREGFASSEAAKQWRRVVSASNIHVINQVDQPTLAAHLAEFNVCIMPFRDLAITRSMNAVKIFEYLAAGKPVLVPDLPETRPLAELGLITVYRSHEDSFRLLSEVAIGAEDAGLVLRRRRFAADNTWNRRVDDLAAAIDRLCFRSN
ncbi:MAG: glycosyltransferase, partial [Bryobacteraceae bacterium]